MNSDRSINYKLRPAKSVERKMMRDLFSRLFPFGGTETYQYIGFGAKYFVDFSLFHKSLHIQDMISIERNTNNKKAYEFNRPFNCIKIKYGHSNDVLPTLPFEKKVIAWLDTDKVLTIEVLQDLSTLVSSCISGSIIVISYNSKPPRIVDLKKRYQVEKADGLVRRFLVDELAEDYIPVGFTDDGMGKWLNYSKVLATIISNHIERLLNAKNFGQPPEEHLLFKQLMYFDYQDDAEMSTFGGILYRACDTNKVDKCCFETFDFVRKIIDPYIISVPNFTYKEMAYLYEHMPVDTQAVATLGLDCNIFPANDVLNFCRVYKYFPNFFESELV